jgi:cytochrome c peroxidase
VSVGLKACADWLCRSAALGSLLSACGTEPLAAESSDAGSMPRSFVGLGSDCASSNTKPLGAKEELGRRLFYDVRLSINEGRACGTCHEQAKGFSDGFPKAIGTTGEVHPRNTLGLSNVARRRVLTWSNPEPASLEQQLLTPLLGTVPLEMGMGGNEAILLERLLADEQYPTAFVAAFPEQEGPTLEQVSNAIAAFERRLLSVNSPLDRYLRGETDALSETARAGLALFVGDAGCVQCHAGCDWDQVLNDSGELEEAAGYFNIGLYDVDGNGAYPQGAEGLANATNNSADMGRYRTPSLRNVAVSGPYFHDGTEFTLQGAIAIHLDGGRNVVVGPNQGDGRASPLRDQRLKPVQLDAEERWQLEVFLRNLSDDEFLTDPRLSNPFR